MSQTESFSNHNDLEKKSTLDLLYIINEEDKKVPIIISKSLKSINIFIDFKDFDIILGTFLSSSLIMLRRSKVFFFSKSL